MFWHPIGWAKPYASSCATVMASNTTALHTTQEGTAANEPPFKTL